MKTYFLAAQVTPLRSNPLADKIESAYVYFWILDSAPEKALKRASDYLALYKWNLVSFDTKPTETTASDFKEQEDGLKGFEKAQQKGFSAQFVAKPRKNQ